MEAKRVAPASSSHRCPVALIRPKLVTDRLWMSYLASRSLRPFWPEMEDDAVGLRCNGRDFFGRRLWHIKDLDPARRNLHFVIMVVLVPCFQWNIRTRNRLCDKMLDVRQEGIRIG